MTGRILIYRKPDDPSMFSCDIQETEGHNQTEVVAHASSPAEAFSAACAAMIDHEPDADTYIEFQVKLV